MHHGYAEAPQTAGKPEDNESPCYELVMYSGGSLLTACLAPALLTDFFVVVVLLIASRRILGYYFQNRPRQIAPTFAI